MSSTKPSGYQLFKICNQNKYKKYKYLSINISTENEKLGQDQDNNLNSCERSFIR